MKKVLFLMQLPPPVHGASMVNESIKNSDYINSKIEAMYIDISPAREMSDLGKLSLRKIFSTFGIFLKCVLGHIRFRPNIVYMTLSPHGFAFWKDALILQACKILGGSTVVHLHGKGINSEVSGSALKLYIYRKVFKNINVIHLSKSLFSDISLVFDKTMSLMEVNNGVGHIKPSKVKKPTDSMVFLYLSNLVPTKGADTLIDAINLLAPVYRGRFKVKIVGKISDESFYSVLVNKVDSSHKDSIEFMGPLYDDDKVKVYNESDVFVLPTRFKNECFPLSILEAMSFSLPILSTYEGAIPDIVDDKLNGGLFHSTSPHELVKKLEYYIDNPDQAKAHGICANAKYKEKYTIEAFEKSFLSALIGDSANEEP